MIRRLAAAVIVMTSAAGAARADGPCAATFDELRGRIEQDYVGFAMAIARRNDTIAAYRAVSEPLRREALQAPPVECTFVLRSLVSYFGDPHVFLLEDPKPSAAEAASFRRDSRPVPQSAGDGRGLTGTWAAPDYDIVVARDGAGFVGVVARARNSAWSAGDVAARFDMRGGEIFATLYRAADRAPLRYPAALQRDGQLLHMPPITWGRLAPGVHSAVPFDPEKPRAPGGAAFGSRVFVLSIPSFSPEHRDALSRILTGNDTAIRRAELLIVDLRGNEGGSSHLGYMLEPYYHATPLSQLGGPRPYPMAISSPRIVRYFERILGQMPPGNEQAMYADFVRRLQASPGRLVPAFERPEVAAHVMARPAPAAVLDGPKRVAILVDRYSVSAAEAFVIEARRSPRVRVFGENTGGSIDYQNVAMFQFGQGALTHVLGLPTLAASDQLPERGFNKDGVPVDVRLTGARDWLGAVARQRW